MRVFGVVSGNPVHDATQVDTYMSTATQTSPAPMTRFNLYLDAELRQQLEQLSAATGCPMGEIFRRATAAWIQQQQNARPS